MKPTEKEGNLRIYTLYDNPSDMPLSIVVRGHTLDYADPLKPRHDPGCIAFSYYLPCMDELLKIKLRKDAIIGAQAHCARLGLVRINRQPGDDPTILECWI